VEDAYKFSYFGLNNMEDTIKDCFNAISFLKLGPLEKAHLVHGDEIINIDEIGIDLSMETYQYDELREEIQTYSNTWRKITEDGMLIKMMNASMDEDEDNREDFVSINKFLDHVRELNYFEVITISANWHLLDEVKQIKLAVEMAGEYNASRFIVFMDCLNSMLDIKKKKEEK